MEKRHAIIIIKKGGRYLQYYDERWSSYLFLNCKVVDEDDHSSIKSEVINKLNISEMDIDYKFDKIHSKFSESAKVMKEYHHYFYIVNLDTSKMNDDDEFIINDVKFKWFSYEDLLNDERIQEVNSDIVSFIKDI